MSKYIYITTILFAFVFLNSATAQELIIKDFKHLTNDISARENQRDDVNDIPCALIKINSGLSNLKFNGNLGIEFATDTIMPGQVWVWVPEGTRQLKISKDGFAMKDTAFGQGLKSLNVYSLTVVSNQSLAITVVTPGVNAKVTINNKTHTTNLPINDIEEGTYPIEITRLGYYPLYDTIKVSFDKKTFHYRLERTHKEMLSINTVPDGADLYFNDSLIGQSNHTAVHFPDEYRVLIKKKNYKTVDTLIVFNPNIQSEFNFELLENTAELKIKIQPEEATVYIDNEIVTEKKLTIEAGVNHELKVMLKNYETFNETFSLERNSSTEKSVKLKINTGTLSVNVNPNGAKIELEHEESGEYTKGKGNRTYIIPEGSYNLTISKKGYNTKEASVVVKRNESTTYTGSLSIAGADRGRAGIYSALLPGWGQLHSHRKIIGTAFMAGTLGLAATSIYYNSKTKKLDRRYESAVELYKNSYDMDEVIELGDAMKDAYDKYDVIATKRDKIVNVFLAAYFVNIVDAVVFAKFYSPNKRHKMKVGYVPVKHGGAVALTYKF